jgi:hypothetical protein
LADFLQHHPLFSDESGCTRVGLGANSLALPLILLAKDNVFLTFLSREGRIPALTPPTVMTGATLEFGVII